MTSFLDVATNYHYRHAYLPDFFEGCADTLKLDGFQRMLDVVCGIGAVTQGFSPYVDSIVAFEESKVMQCEG